MTVSIADLLGRLSELVDLWFVSIATLALILAISSGQVMRVGVWLEDLGYRLTHRGA